MARYTQKPDTALVAVELIWRSMMHEERRPGGINFIVAGLALLLLVGVGGVIASVVSQFAPTVLNTQREVSVTPTTSQEMPLYQQQPTATLRSVTRPTAPPAPDYAVSAGEASTIALNAAPDARLVQLPELVNFEGNIAYEVLLDQGTAYVDAESGAVLYSSVKVSTEVPTPQERISREQAITIAVEYAGGGSVYEASLEDEYGKLVYEVKLTNNSKVYVDAATGEVVWARLNDPNDPDDDDHVLRFPGSRERPNFGWPNHIHPHPGSHECPDFEQPYSDDEDEDNDNN